MEEQQRAAFERAVERKKHESRIASEQTQHDNPAGDKVDGPVQESLISTATTQDAFDPRDKNSGKGKKTADKWNQ
jgi:hypothetical protein